MEIIKRTFYPLPEVEAILKIAPAKKVSERVNSLILMGLQCEKAQQMLRDYQKFNDDLTNLPANEKKSAEETSRLLASRLFDAEDEVKGWY